VLGLAVSAGLLFVFFQTSDLRSIAGAIGQVNWLSIVPAVGVYFLGVWLRAVRWRFLILPFAEIATARLFRVIVIGFAVNNVLPFRLGELVRAFVLRNSDGVPIAATLASIVLERVLDVVALCVLLALVTLFVPLDGWLAALGSVAWLGVACAGLGLAVLALAPRNLLRRLMDSAVAVASRPSEKLGRLAESFLSGMRAVETPRAMIIVGALSLACWVAELGLYYLLMIGFAFNSGILGLIAGMVAANLATVLPSSPGYVGTFDVPLQSVLSESFGVAPLLASSYTLFVHAALLVPVTIVGLVFLSWEDLSIRALSRGRVELRSVQGGEASL
jgi:uncharacterized protein (TIRG00374 family)